MFTNVLKASIAMLYAAKYNMVDLIKLINTFSKMFEDLVDVRLLQHKYIFVYFDLIL